jgi:tryptophan synthase alpha chain
MGYANPLFRYGIPEFFRDAAAAGADGCIVVDVPCEEEAVYADACDMAGMAWVRLVAPTTDPVRLPKVVQRASGMLYYVGVTGITGTKTPSPASVSEAMQQIRTVSCLPTVVGFGIRTPEHVQALRAVGASGIVVGSALVALHAAEGKDRAVAWVRTLASALQA